MKLILKKEHTGKHNYTSNRRCPIACAMKDAGYTEVVVGGSDIDYRTPDGEHYHCVPLSVKLSSQAEIWANKEQAEDIEFEIEIC